MSVTPSRLCLQSLSSGASAVVTGANNAATVVKRAVFTNVGTTIATVTAYVVPTTQAASTSNMVLDAYSISPGASYVSPELAGVTLAGGDAIYALAAVGSVNLMINGVVIV